MIRPRADERKAIVALLEGGEFESPEALADEVIRTTYRLFQRRDWELWCHREDGLLLLFGPFTGDNEARKLATEAGLGGENRIYKVSSVAAMQARIEQNALTSGTCTCGHPKGLHEHAKQSGRCVDGHMSGSKWIFTCDCKDYEEKR